MMQFPIVGAFQTAAIKGKLFLQEKILGIDGFALRVIESQTKLMECTQTKVVEFPSEYNRPVTELATKEAA